MTIPEPVAEPSGSLTAAVEAIIRTGAVAAADRDLICAAVQQVQLRLRDAPGTMPAASARP